MVTIMDMGMVTIMDIPVVMVTMGITMIFSPVALAMAVITAMVVTMEVMMTLAKVLDNRGMSKIVECLKSKIV